MQIPPSTADRASARTRRRFLRDLAWGLGGGVLAGVGAAGPAMAGRAGATASTAGTDGSTASPGVPDRRIVVTTPTGTLGAQVLHHLLAAPVRVRVVARDPDRLPAEVRARAEIVVGSHGDAAVIAQACEGADAVFWLCPPDPQASSVASAYVDFARPAAAAFARYRVPRVVGISALGRGTPLAAEAGFVTGSLAMDDLIAASGVHFRALVMPSFMDNIARQAPAIRERGVFFGPIPGDVAMPAVASRDIAGVAASLLLAADWTGQREQPVLGPEDLSFDAMAAIASEVLGRPVRYVHTTYEAYRDGFVQRGMSAAMAQGMADMARAKAGGLDNAVARTRDNRTPTTFRTWCLDTLRPLVDGDSRQAT
ncbi:NAD(P)H-binding protein [Luteimonas abyssi]|uniref:NAD(P)H-binding protein n=1 Tax=Luteimonas abyssi TaxID=1247514 RepID=UPI000AF64F86|nr:NAD(P)H-binding protein [Luteimonas abyssi]